MADPYHDFTLDKENICIFVPSKMNLEEKNFLPTLKQEMINVSFKLFDNIEISDDYIDLCDSIIFFFLKQESKTIDTVRPVISTSKHSGHIYDYGTNPSYSKYSGETKSTDYLPYSYDYNMQAITIKVLHKNQNDINPKTGLNTWSNIWFSVLVTSRDDYKKYAELFVNKMLSYYGKNYEGKVNIDVYSERRKRQIDN